MKAKISFSRFATILTWVILVCLFVGCIATIHEIPAFFMLLAIYLVMIVSALFYGPAYIKADADNIVMCSILKSRKIPLREVERVELFRPAYGAIRIFASGGFMGYWGVFREGGIGRYYAFYGKASDCFLVSMKNGDKYVLGCDKPDLMVDYINSHTSK